jgi:hypothetical protein
MQLGVLVNSAAADGLWLAGGSSRQRSRGGTAGGPEVLQDVGLRELVAGVGKVGCNYKGGKQGPAVA